jgi:hypothetical protein
MARGFEVVLLSARGGVTMPGSPGLADAAIEASNSTEFQPVRTQSLIKPRSRQ